ncbi:uncharacterized protein LOC136076223 [Hydra vulgaris]|uniref:ATP-dependent DNA helicase n=1 Tax=Hydra vulgaris TaxID=6087 RepID=A0ABM4BA46_HYDVU
MACASNKSMSLITKEEGSVTWSNHKPNTVLQRTVEGTLELKDAFRIARSWLATPPTSALSERLFSAFDLVITNHRYTLDSDKIIRKFMFTELLLIMIELLYRGNCRANDDKLETAQDINNLICTEIPDPVVNRELYGIIKTCTIHGLCGILNPNSPCIKDGVCSKNYPKKFNANTVAVHNGYPQYRRRDDGLVINIKGNNVDNQHDCANVLINEQVNHNEVNTSLDCRYVSAPEALWRIFEYPISHMSHTNIRLKVHLPENQIVYFREEEEQVALDHAAQRNTHLTAWFKFNENEGSHRYSYVDIPYHFVFDDKHCKWKPKGATSWADLCTVNGIVLETFREACVLKDFNLENLNNNVQQSIDEANRMRPLLNVNQLNVSNAVLAALNEQPGVENQHSRLFITDGPAGSEKTFTYNYLVAETISRGFKSATAAWTGIAATLLTNGSTLHNLFKIPVPILDNTTCNVTPNSIHGQFLKQVSLFLLDETSMIPKHALNAIDRLLKDVCNNNFPFGGKVILFGGDFRQILPVVKRGQPAEIVESCIKCSIQWRWEQKFTLTENMRVHDGEREFSQWLLKLGSGTMSVKEEDPFKGCIEIPHHCIIRKNESIVEKIFGDADQNDYSKRVILTLTNVDSLSINEEVLECLPGEVKIYLSADQIDTDDLNERNNFLSSF